MKIVVIDSGVNDKIFSEMEVKQIRFYNHEAFEEIPQDYLGHGTAIVSCFYSKYPHYEYYSLCPGIDQNGVIDSIIEAHDIADAIMYAIMIKADFINISMGTTDFANRKCIDDAVSMAFEQGIIIVASAPNESIPSLPWGCKNVIKVRESKGNGYRVTIETDIFGIKNFVIHSHLYKVTTMEGKKIFAHGNSYAAAWLTSLLIEKKNQYNYLSINNLLQEIVDASFNEINELIQQKYLIVSENDDFRSYVYKNKRLILYSWSKEMHSIVRGSEYIGYHVVAAIDLYKKGNIGKDIGILSNTSEYGVKLHANISEISIEADILVIGYLDQIAKYDSKFTHEYILEYNLNYLRLHVFSFTPVEEKWINLYKKKGLIIRYPFVFDDLSCNRLLQCIHSFIPIKKPILGIFGTSSKQGKFTLQIALRERFKEKKISCFHMSTEHQAAILGADFTFADGYQNNLIMKVNLEKKLQALKAIMVYIDNSTSDDMILVGGQSWVIPYEIKEQTFMRHAIFLEGVKPDRTIVVINPLLDNIEYVKDTISALKSIYKCITFAVAFSDYTPYIANNSQIKNKKLKEEDIQCLSEKWTKILGIPCGCIMDSNYIDALVDCTIKEFT